MLYEYIEEHAYGIHLCFVLQKREKKIGAIYISPLSSIRVLALVCKKKVMNYTGNRYIPEGFTCLRILYTLVMDQIPIKCDMNGLSLCLKKGSLCQMYVEN